jgi:hypothetical protein
MLHFRSQYMEEWAAKKSEEQVSQENPGILVPQKL